jgi:formylglycine-generating enzyme required for sulfatase activity/TPR repeat protein
LGIVIALVFVDKVMKRPPVLSYYRIKHLPGAKLNRFIILLAICLALGNTSTIAAKYADCGYLKIPENLKSCQLAAHNGNAKAQYALGLAYGWHGSLTRNQKLADSWIEKAAKQGHPKAQILLGFLYYDGARVERNFRTSLSWFEKALKKGEGDADVFFVIGVIYVTGGDGVEANYAKSFHWTRKAAKLGNAKSQLGLGLHYFEGKGIYQDYLKSYFWLRLATSQGLPETKALTKLTTQLLTADQKRTLRKRVKIAYVQTKLLNSGYYSGLVDGISGVETTRALRYLQILNGLNQTGTITDETTDYLNGLKQLDSYSAHRAKNNTARSVKIIKKAESGDKESQQSIGFILEDKKKYGEAIKWYSKASKQGYAEATLNLGNLYADRAGAKQDFTQAYYFYSLAIAQGKIKTANYRDRYAAEDATEKRTALAKRMTPVQIAKAQKRAAKWKPTSLKKTESAQTKSEPKSPPKSGSTGSSSFVSKLGQVSPTIVGKRIALVIGNSAYQHTAKLSNPQNDATLMARTLRGLGFDVLARTNLTQTGMKIAITEFGERLEKAGKDAVGLFYYAGHGIQANGNNYLIPVDAKLGKKSHLDIYGVNANWVLTQMEEAKNPLNLMVLDACRNNPFGRSWQRGITKGLARMDAPRGTMIAYATRPGKVANDGTGVNSPYTEALTRAMVKPGLTLSDVFIETRNSVMASTGGNQVPWEEGGLTSRFYFKPGSTLTIPTTTPKIDKETVFWNSIKDSDDTKNFQAYLNQYPSGSFVSLARIKLKKLLAAKQVAVVTPPKPKVPRPATPTVGVYPKSIKPGTTFKDCPECPEMVVIPAGNFQMGDLSGFFSQPVHQVTIPKPIAIGKFEVTRKEFAAFVRATGHSSEIYTCADKVESDSESWRKPGHPQTDRDPVVCVNWHDAEAYVGWLAKKTGKKYRLLSEAEWEYAARAGTTTKYSWGDTASHEQANYGRDGGSPEGFSSGRDQWKYTSPVGSFSANAFGLYDMHGNVWEWVGDCWNGNYKSAPTDGAVWSSGNCSKRVLRGGSWVDSPSFMRSAFRFRGPSWAPGDDGGFGFRIARTPF